MPPLRHHSCRAGTPPAPPALQPFGFDSSLARAKGQRLKGCVHLEVKLQLNVRKTNSIRWLAAFTLPCLWKQPFLLPLQ